MKSFIQYITEQLSAIEALKIHFPNLSKEEIPDNEEDAIKLLDKLGDEMEADHMARLNSNPPKQNP